ncbi:hypothetical protein BT96DRAFT_1027510 [Gymnopus androsaceus JB14]|uniref:Uncharacterized protein n=1 Tax=Gymnopus androsaceus JB14 TaxID=1447944 RepID=A0A6A4GBD7_9AGAR|nr:hypothetical protein BT96DRAFT_1027510 [Gymnopus androsaceus JB14]
MSRTYSFLLTLIVIQSPVLSCFFLFLSTFQQLSNTLVQKPSPRDLRILKVEGTQLARSHPSRTDHWNEDLEITVDKANEVEKNEISRCFSAEIHTEKAVCPSSWW